MLHALCCKLTARALFVALALLPAVLGMAACGGGGPQADASKADIGKDVMLAPWKLTLNGVPETADVVGDSGITYAAQNGTFVIVPVTVVNEGSDITLFPKDLVFLKDGQGREFPLAGSSPQFAYIQGKQGLDMLVDAPLVGGQTRNTILMFDVPSDAAGFTLTFSGSEEIVNLGY
jgi:hypothetical protein